jgi:acyl dehydratase
VAERTLSGSPSLPLLYARAALTAIGRGGASLPEDSFVLDDVSIDPDRLARYCRVCGFSLTDRLPVTYPHVLAFPLAVALMVDRSFPLALPGLVHIANTIEQGEPLVAGDRLRVRVRAERLHPHPRGRQVDLVAEVAAGGRPVWIGRSTYLARGGGSGGAERREPDRSGPEPVRRGTWRVPGDIGRRYAAVSGDVNPIHLHPLTARLFGFPRAIAHGMWTGARALAALEGRLPGAVRVDLRFQRPLRVPGTVVFGSAALDGGWVFDVRDPRTGEPHLTGRAVAATGEGGSPAVRSAARA